MEFYFTVGKHKRQLVSFPFCRHLHFTYSYDTAAKKKSSVYAIDYLYMTRYLYIISTTRQSRASQRQSHRHESKSSSDDHKFGNVAKKDLTRRAGIAGRRGKKIVCRISICIFLRKTSDDDGLRKLLEYLFFFVDFYFFSSSACRQLRVRIKTRIFID